MKHRKPINKGLYEISRVYWNIIPFGEIDKVFREHGFKLIQEDGTDWEGFFLGEKGRATISIATLEGEEIHQHSLILEWYKMQSGRWEINTYLS
jgi:hypothetical protein